MASTFLKSRVRPVGLLVAALTAVFGTVLIPEGAASASTGGYAFIQDNTHADGSEYTGNQVTRYDSAPSSMSGSDCSTFMSSSSDQVMQFIEIQTDQNGESYIEFGTLHQCDGDEWWFEQAVVEGTVEDSWDKSISGSDEHTFYMFQNGSGDSAAWHFQIDSTVEHSWTAGEQGTYAFDAVSYYSPGTGGQVSTYQDSALHYTYNQGSWTAYGSPTAPNQAGNACAALASGSTTIWDMGVNHTC